MSKPIFIVRLPYDEKNRLKDKFESFHKHITEQLHDYHVLSLVDNRVESIEFERYNSSYAELEFEELKKRVEQTFNHILTNEE